MNPLDPFLPIAHSITEHIIPTAWEHAEPVLEQLGLNALQSIDPHQVLQLVPDQTWQSIQNFAQVPDCSQPQPYELMPSFEPAQHEFQTQPLTFEPSHALLESHQPVSLRMGSESEYHLNEANKALADAAYHTDQAATHGETANWYAVNHDKVVFGESKAEFESKWADEEKAKADAKLKEAADEMSKANLSS